MRRMRGFSWRHWLLAVPAVGAALGLQYWLRMRFPTSVVEDMTAFVLKPSHFYPDSGSGLADSQALAAAKRKGIEEKRSGWQYLKPSTSPVRKADGFLAVVEEGADESGDDDFSDQDKALEQARAEAEQAPAAPAGQEAPTPLPPRKSKTADDMRQERFSPNAVALNGKKAEDPYRIPAAKAPAPEVPSEAASAPVSIPVDEPPAAVEATASAESVGPGGKCGAIEYRGDGPQETKITKDEWERTVTLFNDVKGQLIAWLDQNRTGFPDATSAKMEERIREISLVKPPVMDEPDLTWRGIGVVALSAENEPIVRIGSGLVKLAVKQPLRARFELARIVAQAWAPCELQRLGVEDAWNPLLECLGVKENDVCGPGTYSEGAWAVSTTLAAAVAPADCTVPAFAKPEVAKCVKKVPLPLMLARDHGLVRVSKVSSNSSLLDSVWPFSTGRTH